MSLVEQMINDLFNTEFSFVDSLNIINILKENIFIDSEDLKKIEEIKSDNNE